MDKVVLAYSGGLDTSVSIKWLEEKYGLKTVAMTVDVGDGKDNAAIKERALKAGALECYVVDAKKDFAENYCWPALKANALYMGKYPLSAGLSRPLIVKYLVEVAEKEGAVAVAHGCTGKGNDQVRFDVSTTALNPALKVIAPVREWPMTREDEIDYAHKHNIPIPVGKKSPYSIDQNLWGRSIECGVLEDPWNEPPEDIYIWTLNPGQSPDKPTYVEIGFEKGVPVSLNGEAMDPVNLILTLHDIAGQNGVGRIDMVEDRLVGIKSREIYEAPAAVVLIAAHRELENLTLSRETLQLKPMLEQKYAEIIYNGLWYSQAKEALDAFIDKTQETVTGTVRLKLWKGQAIPVGRKSPYSLYDFSLATYAEGDEFKHDAAVGFIQLWGLPTKVYATMKKNTDAGAGAKGAAGEKQKSGKLKMVGD